MHPSVTESQSSGADYSAEQAELVRLHLEEILASGAFISSKRSQDFLRLVVTRTLEGNFDGLHERMIGAELFGRPVSYDTGSDSVVRVRASEARKKLALFYSQRKEASGRVRIELPAGSYVARFHFDPASDPEPIPAETSLKPPKNSPPLFAAADSVDQTSLARRMNSRRLRVFALAIVAVSALLAYQGYRVWRKGSAAPPARHSLAVLPLKNLSGSPEQDYFADGMTEELINDFGQLSTLRVTSLTSSMSYKGSTLRLPEIARQLGVDSVLEGGVSRSGNQIRVSAQLVDAKTDRPVWAQTYVHQLANGADWQGEIARSIAAEISATITPQEQERLSRKRLTNPEAHDLYLHGIFLRDHDDCQGAMEYLRRAIAIDSNEADFHSALASCYGLLGESGRMPYVDAFSSQKTEAEQAIALDSSSYEGHAELANTAMTLDHNWTVAEVEFRRALELNPSSSTSHEKYAFYLVRTGHPNEALAEIEQSVALDPVSGSTFHAQGFIYYFCRRYDDALSVSRTVQGLKVNLSDWNFLLGDIYLGREQFDAAIAAFLQAPSGPYTYGHLGNAYARAGKTDAARKLVAQLKQSVEKTSVGRYEIALIYAGMGDRDTAFQWLEDAYRAHDVGLVYMKVDPCLDPLRSDSRFDSLLRRVGLSQ